MAPDADLPSLLGVIFIAAGGQHDDWDEFDQADIFPDLANPSFQDHANEAIHRFIRSLDGEELR